ncbi:hypothetical protein HPP92_009584 [Vanilla planifolia]|uniref:Uncharacterized protein n=1 Tax=Vanilla planifolia TaxID=51239 RepID=A0A835RCN3_VANPL|nr:hypothetical protein HPP92_009584 [Vanilla planifolia]
MASSTAAEGGGFGVGTVMSRLERLDLMMQCLEEIKGGSGRRSSCPSTSSSSAATGGCNSPQSPPPPPDRPLRSMEEAIVETLLKGSLIDRIVFLETRFLQMEEEMEKERKRETEMEGMSPKSGEKRRHKLGLKSMVKSCVRGT